MQKATSVLLGALVLAVIALVIWWAAPRSSRPAAMTPMAPSSSVAAAPAGSEAPDAAAIEALLDETLAAASRAGAAGTRLLDGSVPPTLPEDAPKALRFGVVLVQYRGAQRASRDARSKAEALELAESLAALAQNDFKAAVEKGDPGSSLDVGRIGINVLEPAPNYVLFSLPVGGVGGPVDTPTGYWIIKNAGK